MVGVQSVAEPSSGDERLARIERIGALNGIACDNPLLRSLFLYLSGVSSC